jgi:hypothetical protein
MRIEGISTFGSVATPGRIGIRDLLRRRQLGITETARTHIQGIIIPVSGRCPLVGTGDLEGEEEVGSRGRQGLRRVARGGRLLPAQVGAVVVGTDVDAVEVTEVEEIHLTGLCLVRLKRPGTNIGCDELHKS